MRLIDGDNLYNDINNYALKYMCERDTWKLSELEIMRQMLEWTLKIVATTETIEPVKHGHWILKNSIGSAVCSVCSGVIYNAYDKNANKFCHVCGASMVEECNEGV